jgi:hypothetical protein
LIKIVTGFYEIKLYILPIHQPVRHPYKICNHVVVEFEPS